jgi:methionine-S-sulfoxide reductase
MPGVVRTRVGYAGGTKQGPTYRDLGDHAETIQIDYDPERMTYRELLRVFWTGHDPLRRSWSRQYASIIFTHNEEQRRLAEETKDRTAKELRGTVHTEIVPYAGFTLAENYHQKHSLQQYPEFMEELRRTYPAPDAFVASTAAARLNGYLGGEGSYEALVRDLDGLGLSPARRQTLAGLVQGRARGQACPLPNR